MEGVCGICHTEITENTEMIITQAILDDLSAQAKASPRLRMNLNFHESLEDKCHHFLNAVEPGADIPIHHHPTKEESFFC